ncbi:hypothetical protein IKB17_01995 [bacterium]|nr:hypothetical protein [bacterium]
MIDFRFRRVEVIIFAIYLIFGVAIIIRLLLDSKPFNEAIGVVIMGPICALALVIEHKKQLIFNREDNKFTIVEKALFRNEFKVIKQMQLSDITGATIHSYTSKSKNSSTRMYELHIDSATEGTILPFRLASSNATTFTNFANKINNFLAGGDISLIINHAPFFARIMGTFFSIIYFLLCSSLLLGK